MKTTFKKGLSFGITSGVITTIGLMVGLDAATSSRIAVIGGIVSIAVADALSDALGVHMFEEASKKTEKQIWESSTATFLAKFIFAISFIVPMLLFELQTAVLIGVLWGLVLITMLSYKLALLNKESPAKEIGTHLVLTLVVLVLTRLVGMLVAVYF